MAFKETISNEEIMPLPLVSFEGKIHVVNTLEKQEKVIKALLNEEVLGFDTETKPTFKKGVTHEVALVQLATRTDAWLFRVFMSGIGEGMISLFEDPKIKKLGIAIDDDLIALNRYKPFTPQGFVSFEKTVKDLGIQSNGLRKLAAIILSKRISKSAQVSNWEEERLSDKQLKYAATDAWICLEMYFELVENKWDISLD
ncbi:MAG: 3'-5' exonuclease domain-containing protein 2 [Cyclobacteriaceae bacterium]|nr:3'-5' exonuclease domain-containing protein 2 [Cyclobacteriaceae bacterium]